MMNIDKNLIRKDIVSDGERYNDFKDAQDRKYYLWSVFEGFMNGAKDYGKPLKITKYVGSDQVILELKGKTIYDSNTDKFTSESFVNWLTDLFVRVIQLRKEQSKYSRYMRVK